MRKKVNKYYDGPEGFYYDVKHDELFILEITGARMLDIKNSPMKDLGACYHYESKKYKSKRNGMGIPIIWSKDCIFLGPL